MIKTNGAQFAASFDQWAKQQQVNMDALARQSCQELSFNVVISTPVDTGFLRSSWQPSIGNMTVSMDSTADPTGAAALSRVYMTITGVKAGDLYHMTNNAAYAKRLEFGFVGTDSLGRSYNQKGRFFVTDNIKKFDTFVKKVISELKPKDGSN